MAEERNSRITYQQVAQWAVIILLAIFSFGATREAGRIDMMEKTKLDKEQYYREYDNLGIQIAELKKLMEQHVQLQQK